MLLVLKGVPRGGGRADGVRLPPPWRLWGPRRPQARAGKDRGSPLPLRPRTEFRAQQNTSSPSGGPLEGLGPQINSQPGPLEAWGPLELDEAPDEEPISS